MPRRGVTGRRDGGSAVLEYALLIGAIGVMVVTGLAGIFRGGAGDGGAGGGGGVARDVGHLGSCMANGGCPEPTSGPTFGGPRHTPPPGCPAESSTSSTSTSTAADAADPDATPTGCPTTTH